MTVLTDLRPGDAFLVALRITDRDQTGLQCTMHTTGRQARGDLHLNPDLTITGAWRDQANTIEVTTLDRAFQVGDVVVRDTTGETLVVRSAWITGEGWRWSSSPQRSSIYGTDGWTVVGTVTLS